MREISDSAKIAAIRMYIENNFTPDDIAENYWDKSGTFDDGESHGAAVTLKTIKEIVEFGSILGCQLTGD